MVVLGLSFDFHDAAAAILVDGNIIAATEEERISRKKHDSGFPKLAIDFCLEQAGLEPSDIDQVVFYEDPFLKLDRILKASFRHWPRSKSYLAKAFEGWSIAGKLNAHRRIRKYLGISSHKITNIGHHQSHAAVAFFNSPFQKATVLTVDGVGEYETVTISEGEENQLKKVKSLALPNSVGLLYSAFTAFLGFEVNEGEYKVMGMAGFGQPKYVDDIWKVVTLRDNGEFEVDESYFHFLCPERYPYTEKFAELFGKPRKPGSTFSTLDFLDPQFPSSDAEDIKIEKETGQHYADLAASIQKVTEEILLHIVRHAVNIVGSDNLCIAGGVGLNSVANNRMLKELGLNVYVHPAAGDGGGALGAAQYYFHHTQRHPRMPAMTDAYLGRSYSQDEIMEAVHNAGLTDYVVFEDDNELITHVAKLICDNNVIGWFQGRWEWGPRALGSRSILANPMNPNMKEIVNMKIKFREPFRPFAPSVIPEEASRYFDVADDLNPSSPEYFMLAVAPVHEEYQTKLPAITHVDKTARVQVVNPETNPRYYALIKEVGRQQGCSLVLNTSFNLKGEPMTSTPASAIRTFEWCEMDYLILGNTVVKKGF